MENKEKNRKLRRMNLLIKAKKQEQINLQNSLIYQATSINYNNVGISFFSDIKLPLYLTGTVVYDANSIILEPFISTLVQATDTTDDYSTDKIPMAA
jgi:hypothetical protein